MKSTSERKRTRASETPVLGPGIHAVTVELGTGGRFRIRTMTGARVVAQLADGLERELVEECIHARRMVLAADGERGPVILGALQMSRTPAIDREGTLALTAKTLRLRAEKAIELDVGPASLALQENGVVQLRGDRMVLNIAALVRVLSARVELP